MSETIFLMLFKSEAGERLARIVVESLRTFGGPLSNSPVWAFVPQGAREAQSLPGLAGVQCIPLAVEEACRAYPFADKVAAFARAEEMAGREVRALVWLSLDCLIVNPPLLFALGPECDAAFRPVHHRNVGSPAGEPLDAYWAAIYRALQIGEMPHTVCAFADGKTLRPYLNTHCFALSPGQGLGRAWREHLAALIRDEAFQAGPCRDELHRIFLHQAVLSTLVAKLLDWGRVRLLPPEYNYPLHLLGEMSPERRAGTLNGLVNAVYEDAFPWGAIEVHEPLHSWLRARLPG